MAQTLIFVSQEDQTGAKPLGSITIDGGKISEVTGVAKAFLETVQMMGSNDQQAFDYFSSGWSNGSISAFPKPE